MKKNMLRATWISSVINLDWPSAASLKSVDPEQRIAQQKTELIHIMDELAELNMNTAIFQIVPCSDALYASKILPWSSYLTGNLGQDPGFDPLAFALAEAKKRDLKLHAWLNPYRVSMDTSANTEHKLRYSSPDSAASVFLQHPEWIGTAANRFLLNPGIPAVQKWVAAIVAEVISQYDVDGIQFDDYFYYESIDSKLEDDNTFLAYNSGFTEKVDWRRDNTYQLMKACKATIQSINPRVQFGISPSGVWRNNIDDPYGSATEVSNPSYDVAFADTRRWVVENIIDYIAPQIYWPFARENIHYDVIAQWWANNVRGTHTKLYIGMALYKVGLHSDVEPDWSIKGGVPEIARQLDLNDALLEISGCILFRHTMLREVQTQAVVQYLYQRWQEL